MFYYIASKNPMLEVSIVKNYTETDLEHVFLFMDTLIKNPDLNVLFKVEPSIKEQFKSLIEKRSCRPSYAYNIIENIA
ncbi:hypothetical protein ULMS_12230 [Patiriisocius marinistellae]|uniref:Uncharacterized protein n=1 Tax=Patiriisocius marinistellae TaxID=2494560 RepID=A0A5J4G059_9FLAO|nr:hypothetical protein [Patiriisocius marinistellae]GEQ85715.1 hypothetical protein ULMS_12230 [Patiriisocius marinistellae]